jgi:hypothetical protein
MQDKQTKELNMPVVMESVSGVEQADASLLGADGNMTVEARIVEAFVSALDFNALFEDAEIKPYVTTEEGYCVESEDGEFVEAAEGDEGAVLCVIESISGDVAHLLMDEDDLANMYADHAANLPSDTLAEATTREIALNLADLGRLEALEEAGPWKKGSFRKVHKGKGGPKKVNDMLGAMIAKGVIKRAKAKGPGTPRKDRPGFTNQGGVKGQGYKGGDYDKNPPGYGTGTTPRLAVWRKWNSKKSHTDKAAKARKLKGVKTKSKYATKKLVVAPKKGPAKKAALAKAAEKTGKVKKSNAMNASTGLADNLIESVTNHNQQSLASGMVKKLTATK